MFEKIISRLFLVLLCVGFLTVCLGGSMLDSEGSAFTLSVVLCVVGIIELGAGAYGVNQFTEYRDSDF